MTENQTLNKLNKTYGKIVKLAANILSVVVFADGVIQWLLGTPLFFAGTSPAFKVAMGFIAITLSSSNQLGEA
jgi:hypothetical protein